MALGFAFMTLVSTTMAYTSFRELSKMQAMIDYIPEGLEIEKTVANSDGSPLTDAQRNKFFDFVIHFDFSDVALPAIEEIEAEEIESIAPSVETAEDIDIVEFVGAGLRAHPIEEIIYLESEPITILADIEDAEEDAHQEEETIAEEELEEEPEQAIEPIDVATLPTVVSFQLRHGESKVFTDLPFGTHFAVEEINIPANFTVNHAIQEGTITAYGILITFINTYQRPPTPTPTITPIPTVTPIVTPTPTPRPPTNTPIPTATPIHSPTPTPTPAGPTPTEPPNIAEVPEYGTPTPMPTITPEEPTITPALSPSPTPPAGGDGTPNRRPNRENPRTGDETNLALWVVLAVLSLSGLGSALVIFKMTKRHYKPKYLNDEGEEP